MKNLYVTVSLLVWALLSLGTAQEGNLYDINNRHANPDAAIDAQNVSQLAQAWMIPTEEHVSHAPLIEGGRVYFADWGGNVYAADAVTGAILWQTQAQPEVMSMWPWYGFAGTGALSDTMFFQASTEGMAYALDKESGEVLWQTEIAEDEHAGSISKLLYYDGLVFIGLSSVEEALDAQIEDFTPDFQGRVLALDAATGEIQWDLQLAEAPQTGAGMWSSFALDPERDLLYFSTSNSYVTEASPYSDAVLAVRPRTGEIVWANQVTQGDLWTMAEPVGPDYAFGAGAQLFEAEVDGTTRELVGAGQKSGFFHAFDRDTGELVWQTFVGYGAAGGGIHTEGSVGDGVVYVWSNNNNTYGAPPEERPITIKALDAATGATLWFKNQAQPAGIPAASMLANDVYFVGSIDGTLKGYSAADGSELWSTTYQDAVATPLNVVGNTLFFGTGIPERFGGQSGSNGMVAYSVGGQVDLTATGGAMGTDTTGTGDAEALATERVTVSLVEWAIEMPATLSMADTGRNPGQFIFEVTNNGTAEHNFEIEGQGMEREFESNLQPGETQTMTVTLQPGTYRVYCPIGSHAELGMDLQLTVTE